MNRIDLSGIWKLYMDSSCSGSVPITYNDEICLPDTTSHASKGSKSSERASGYLTDPYKFEGYAWYCREFTVPQYAVGEEMFIKLERTRMTELYIDGRRIGENSSLCTPHLYRLPELGCGVHKIEICVKNVGYPTRGGHLTSPDTQTNWNGITGRIEFITRPKGRIDDVKITSDIDSNSIEIIFSSNMNGEAFITVDGYGTISADVINGINKVIYTPEKKMPLWDEFTPEVLTLCIAFNGEIQRVPFGMRKISADGRKLLINGRETFLRGKHDGMIFPLTGYAPTDVSGWLEVMKTARSFGINHYRFHTCCPPEAAFEAADVLGIYLQPELPFWGTIEDEITEEQKYLIEEGFRILRTYGNHPSFVMMSLGNELWGSKEILNKILADYKEEDNRHLYTDGSNNFQFVPCVLENADFLSGVRLSHDRLYRGSYAICDAPLGFIQTDRPNTVHNYDKIISPDVLGESTKGGKIKIQYGTGIKEVDADGAEMFIPNVPVISHEVGQYETYPDYNEIEKYTGTLKAENIALYKEKAVEKGIIGFSDKFFRASGALAVDCYKREIEAALKSDELSGFQLLDIQDFTGQGTALVGILNSLMQPKGTVSAKEWRGFCSSTVIMAEFEKFVFNADEKIEFGLTLFNTSPYLSAENVSWFIYDDDKLTASGNVKLSCGGKVTRLGKIAFVSEKITRPTEYRLELTIDGTDICNSYIFFVYPDLDISITENEIKYGEKAIRVIHDISEAGEEPSVYVPSSDGKLEGTYCTDFWCYPMFRSISESMNRPVPIGTMGCLINSKSPLLEAFNSRTYSTPQWFEIIKHSHCENLDGTDIIPDVWMIDNPDRAQRLGIIYTLPKSRGKTIVCTSRLWEISDLPEARWLAYSLIKTL